MEHTIISDEQEKALRTGDRVQHWTGVWGTVVSVSSVYSHESEFANFSQAVYRTEVTVQEDRRPRARKLDPAARWDGIVSVVPVQAVQVAA